MQTLPTLTIALAVATAFACGKKDDTSKAPDPVATADTAVATPPAPDAAAVKMGVSGMHRSNDKWIPAEYKAGRGKWRDAGVYVDGKPVGMLWFGELPYHLEPVWVESVEYLDFKPGDTGPRERMIKERRYRISDYLTAIGVDLAKVKALHLHGGIQRVAMIDGDEFRRMKDELMVSFGTGTYGKAIIHFPAGLKTNTTFDRLSGVMVYIEKPPPTKNEEGEIVLAGNPIYGVPYFGEPLRGGVRVYKDDVMVAYIKRRKLTESKAKPFKGEDGQDRWKLLEFLEAEGVKTDDIKIAAIIYDERRRVQLSREELEAAYFMASPQAKGEILLGKDKTRVNSLALHTEALPPKVIPDNIE